jgi:Xaa-Pro aminopeptidase
MSLSLHRGRWTWILSVRFLFLSILTYRENALIIHYTRNDHLLRDGELVLIDAGGEYKCAVVT